jgi:hypothetical protein
MAKWIAVVFPASFGPKNPHITFLNRKCKVLQGGNDPCLPNQDRYSWLIPSYSNARHNHLILGWVSPGRNYINFD